MTEDERQQLQDFNKELMVLQGQYDDLLKALDDWQKRFFKLYTKISKKLNSNGD